MTLPLGGLGARPDSHRGAFGETALIQAAEVMPGRGRVAAPHSTAHPLRVHPSS
jgi:hypothetical protein